jgi:hypothetical protein
MDHTNPLDTQNYSDTALIPIEEHARNIRKLITGRKTRENDK